MSHKSGWAWPLLAFACASPDTGSNAGPIESNLPTASNPAPTEVPPAEPNPNQPAPSPLPSSVTPASSGSVPAPDAPAALPQPNVTSQSPEPVGTPSAPMTSPSPTIPATGEQPVPAPAPSAPPPGQCAERLPLQDTLAFDCGEAHVLEDHGPPSNRVNYIIVADGYVESELDTALLEHVENMLYNEETGMYSEIGQPYTRYRNFINVCVLRSASNESGVDGPGGNPDRDTAFGGGNCGDRLGCVDDRLVLDYLAEALPEYIDADWIAATMNENEWWNSGGRLMVWSGKFMESSATQAASVALHEGGHAFHGLADEYGDENLNCDCESAREPNVACENSDDLDSETQWGDWIGFVMEGGGRLWNLGEHGAYPGGRYCGPSSGVTRPTEDSEMNLLPYAYNMPSIQKIIRDIYEIVRPIDTHTPNDAPLQGASEVAVRVVDPEVIRLEWSVDGTLVDEDGPECFSLQDLGSGEHSVSVRAIDDTEWVRGDRTALEQAVEWTVIVP